MSGKHARKRHNRRPVVASTPGQDIREASLTNPSPVSRDWLRAFNLARALGNDYYESLIYADSATLEW